MDKKEKIEDPKVALAGTIGAFTVGLAALIVIFARNYAWIIIFTTLIMCFFGIALSKDGYCCESKKEKKK